jgi:hypothetical protein
MRTPTQSLRSLFMAALLFAGAASTLAGSGTPQQSPPAGTRVIVRALTSAGEPVMDLKPSDLTIRTDGRQREVKSLDLVSIAAGQPAAGAAPAVSASPLPPPFATNAAAPPAPPGGREILFVLDEEGVGPGREEPVRNAIGQIVSALGPRDRVGLISLRVGGIQVAPTAERKAQVTEAMKSFVGGGSANESGGDMICRAKRALGTLNGVLRSSPTGRTIVVITPGLPATPAGMGKMGRVDQFSTPELCQIRSSDFEELGASAAGSPANLYVLHYLDGLAAAGNISIAQEGIENIAGTLSAETIRIGGGSEKNIARIPRETASYYLATLDDSTTGAIRRIDAKSTRPEVKVHARPAAAAAGGTATTSAKKMSPRDMLTTTATFSEVPLRATGLVSRQGASDMKLVTFFEPADPSTKLTAASVGLVDEKGTVKSQWSAKPEELERSPITAALPIAPGKYRVRVAATTASGGGAVDFDIVAALQEAAPLKFGGMMLGVTSEKGFAPKLQFSRTDTMAVGVAEVYGVPKGANVTVQFELAESDAAQPRGAAAGNVQNGPTEDARVVFGGFGIETLEPGDYIMRAIVSIDGKVAGTVTRTLRKVTN